MPIETLDDVIERLADEVGVYGAHDDENDDACAKNPCRVCWTSNLRDRLIAAIKVDQKLNPTDWQ